MDVRTSDQYQDQYQQQVIAVLEGLRTSVYPNCRLKDLNASAECSEGGPGWAIGLSTTDEEGKRTFHVYVCVIIEMDETGDPVRFVCKDDAGRVEETPEGDLSKAGLVAALKRLHRRKEGEAWQVWRWLGHLSDTFD